MHVVQPNHMASPTVLHETNADNPIVSEPAAESMTGSIAESIAESIAKPATDPIKESIKEFKVAVESSLRAYSERYHGLGYLEIQDDELVIEMALEGNIFTPDRALQKLLRIATYLQRIEQNVMELRAILLDVGELSASRQLGQVKMQALNKDTYGLMLAIEQDVVPLVHLMPRSQKDVLTAIKEIKGFISYFMAEFEQAIAPSHSYWPDNRQKEIASTMRHCLTQFIAKSQFVSIVSIEIIKSRVPLYRLAE